MYYIVSDLTSYMIIKIKIKLIVRELISVKCVATPPDEEEIKMCKTKRVFDETIELADNAMLKVRPDLFNEWDFEKNDELGLDIYKVTKGTEKVTPYWICDKCGNAYPCLVANKIGNRNCSYCYGRTILKGFNDMWTTNSELAELLLNPEDGHKYKQSSQKRVDWKCSNCGTVITNKRIGNVKNCGLSCPSCSDGKSYPEKFMYHLLRQIGINFKMEKIFEWSQDKKYDFYLPDYDWIIEMHGGQHSGRGFEGLGGRSLEDEQANDRYKEKKAKENNINNYIVIDARFSEFEYIKKSIFNSNLSRIFNLDTIDWTSIEEKSNKSIVIEVWELWNNGLKDIQGICEKVGLSYPGVRNYLKKGSKIGKCSYSAQAEKEKSGWIKNRVTVQLDKDNRFVKEWESMSLINKEIGVSTSCLSNVCKGKRKTAYGFKWMYKEDYDKLMLSTDKQIS